MLLRMGFMSRPCIHPKPVFIVLPFAAKALKLAGMISQVGHEDAARNKTSQEA
jgi:hypothetical protein